MRRPVALGALTLTASCAIVSGLDGYQVVVGVVGDDCRGCDASLDDIDTSTIDTSAPLGDAQITDHQNGDVSLEGGIAPLCDPTDPTLALCFPFEGNAVDNAGSGNVVVSNVTFGPGHVGQAAFFNGTSSDIVVSSSPKLDALTTMTSEVFIRPSTLPAAGTRMGIMDSDSRFGIFLHPGGFQCAGPGAVISTTPLVVGKLTHLACVRDGSNVLGYQDGILVLTGTSTAVSAQANSTMTIGINNPSGDYYVGMIDELRIFSRARTAAEIAAASARGR